VGSRRRRDSLCRSLAKKRINLDLLLEMICLVSASRRQGDARTQGRRLGFEAKLDRAAAQWPPFSYRTARCTQRQLHVGNTFGKVRAVRRPRTRLEEAGPSTPVEVRPRIHADSGDTFLVVADATRPRASHSIAR